MHHAPAVHFAVGPSRWLTGAVWSLWLVGCGVTVVFFTTQPVPLPTGLLWGTMVFIGAALAMRACRAMPSGDLRWDGAHWYWSGFSGALPCHLVLHMDWQHGLLVTVHQVGGHRIWLCLEPQRDQRAWLALRRAVVGARRAAMSHANTDLPDVPEEHV